MVLESMFLQLRYLDHDTMYWVNRIQSFTDTLLVFYVERGPIKTSDEDAIQGLMVVRLWEMLP